MIHPVNSGDLHKLRAEKNNAMPLWLGTSTLKPTIGEHEYSILLRRKNRVSPKNDPNNVALALYMILYSTYKMYIQRTY